MRLPKIVKQILMDNRRRPEQQPAHCTMPECTDTAVKGNRWCRFHIEQYELEMRLMEKQVNDGK